MHTRLVICLKHFRKLSAFKDKFTDILTKLQFSFLNLLFVGLGYLNLNIRSQYASVVVVVVTSISALVYFSGMFTVSWLHALLLTPSRLNRTSLAEPTNTFNLAVKET